MVMAGLGIDRNIKTVLIIATTVKEILTTIHFGVVYSIMVLESITILVCRTLLGRRQNIINKKLIMIMVSVVTMTIGSNEQNCGVLLC